MATKKDDIDREKQRINAIFARLSDVSASEVKNQAPEKGLDHDVADIYKQAHKHRNKLLNFFIWYTIMLSFFVLAIIFLQIHARISLPNQEQLEIVPQWVLYLLVGGMFGQFIGLLAIVTRKVWTFEPFFKHYTDSRNKYTEQK